jgi:hypothetical protein
MVMQTKWLRLTERKVVKEIPFMNDVSLPQRPPTPEYALP